jgi:hypothetical protein
MQADSWVVSAAKLLPCTHFPMEKVKTEVIFKPMVRNNIDQWQVFDNDDHILNLLHHFQHYPLHDLGQQVFQTSDQQPKSSLHVGYKSLNGS